MNTKSLLVEQPKEYNNKPELLSLDERKIKLAEYISLGYKPTQIAEILGVSVGWVRTNKKDQAVTKLVSELQAEALDSARKKIVDNTQKAAEKIIFLMEQSSDERVQLAAAKDLLDRSGIKDKDSQGHSGNTINFNFSQMSMDELKIAILTRVKNLGWDGAVEDV